MFDLLVAEADSARTPGARVAACSRLENAACAARLAAMADMLAAAHAADGSAEREQWRLDNWGAVCAQIGAAHAVTSGVASGLLTDALTLRERLPKLAAIFAVGRIGYRLVHLICARTLLVTDQAALRAVDADLAALLASPAAMSRHEAEQAIDALVARHDPFAVRRTQSNSRGCHADITVDGGSGVAHLDAALLATDGAAVDQRLDALARTVCERDPRTLDQRRAAALGAMGFGWDRLPCLCETDDCDAAARPAAGGVVIHVLAHPDTVAANTPSDTGPVPPPTGPAASPPPSTGPGAVPSPTESDAAPTPSAPEPDGPGNESGSEPTRNPDPTPTQNLSHGAEATAAPVGDLAEQRRALVGEQPPLLPKPWYSYTLSGLTAALNTDSGEHCPARPGVILGGAVLPAPIIAQLAVHAAITPVRHPGQAPPEPRYRPSTALARFVRCRDQTCRFPGCTKPATVCDIDHTNPYPYGPTTASGLACLCREHHLLKTFWPGWHNRQLSDGTIIWTDPDGNKHTTYPGSRVLFPELCAPTAEVTGSTSAPAKHTAGLTMPKRATTRAQDRARRIDDERKANVTDASS
ncbi:DUF222 domain-containing protein [Mycobacterium sp. Y57]|uniref:HNH endonuclease signature motif containing protein n=1 Tax=Mycolicibacterium xanthum TaxID=2796469 RepID=UPI001C866BFC|nr:HNH endonuclease signature motif containing protein [Mycolicibacterium xanthum]MBX7431317.1 DUF222 domain-containing protein [Mycolicibacterium xanthum]